MEANPSGLDLDGNSTQDFFITAAGGSIIPQTYTSGTSGTGGAFSDQGATTPENLFRTDFNGSWTRSLLANADSVFTFEWRVRKTAGAQAADGWFGVAIQNPGASYSSRINLEDDRVSIRTSGSNTDFLVGANFADGELHTVRMSKDTGDNYYFWVNGILLNDDLSTSIAGGNGSFNTGGAAFIGDFTGGIAGDWELDYIAFDSTGAYSPVPEPGTFALLAGLAGMCFVAHRRR